MRESKEVDNGDFDRNPDVFFLQLFYRAVCFERHRKSSAAHLSQSFLRGLDRGKNIASQEIFQTYMDHFDLGHAAGLGDLDGLLCAIQPVVSGKSTQSPLRYFWMRTCEQLPMAGLGCFQPSLDAAGNRLQVVNLLAVVDGKPVVRKISSICLAILPFKEFSLIAVIWIDGDAISEQLVRSLKDKCGGDARIFVTYFLLCLENVFFAPRYVRAIQETEKLNILSIAASGVASDLLSKELDTALATRLSMNGDIYCVGWS